MCMSMHVHVYIHAQDYICHMLRLIIYHATAFFTNEISSLILQIKLHRFYRLLHQF